MTKTNAVLTLEVLYEGIVAPLTSLKWGGSGKPGTFDGGVYYADRSVCERSLHRKSGFINEPQALGAPEGFPRVSGSHYFAGMLKNEHVGHFFVESLSRLWGLSTATGKIDSILFYVRMADQPVPSWAYEFVDLMAPGVPLSVVATPTIYEVLIVPDQVAHLYNGYLYGHPLVRHAFASMRPVIRNPIEKLYVSRSNLPNSGGFLGERSLDQILIQEGFTVIHPEDYSIEGQIALYRGARQLIFAEGTALHLFALTYCPGQQVYIVQRRRNAALFTWQLGTFGCIPVVGPEPPSSYFIPEHHGLNPMYARSRINFEALRRHLVAEHFVEGKNWKLPDEQTIRKEIDSIEQRLGQRLVEHPPSAL